MFRKPAKSSCFKLTESLRLQFLFILQCLAFSRVSAICEYGVRVPDLYLLPAVLILGTLDGQEKSRGTKVNTSIVTVKKSKRVKQQDDT